jgi:hypothetical protein
MGGGAGGSKDSGGGAASDAGGSKNAGGGSAACVTVTIDVAGAAVTVTVGGCAVTVTVLVTVEATDFWSPPSQLPSRMSMRTTPRMLPRMIHVRLSVGGRGPQSRPFQYARPDVPAGSGYQPGGGSGVVIVTASPSTLGTPGRRR